MGLKYDDGEVGRNGHNHQRNEQGVAARELGNEEHAGKRGMEHGAHYAGHAQQSIVGLRHMYAQNVIMIP